MKTLILVRHAKSDWADPTINDIDRPLNGRGKNDAPVMAQRLKERKIKVDTIVSSPAKRAAKTAKIFAETLGRRKEKIIFLDDLYLAAPSAFFKVISKMDKDDDVIALFSHNEGITSFANMLTNVHVDNIPTCGVFAVKADCRNWSEFENAEKEFLFFDYPKAV